jgi:hypothetical protein
MNNRERILAPSDHYTLDMNSQFLPFGAPLNVFSPTAGGSVNPPSDENSRAGGVWSDAHDTIHFARKLLEAKFANFRSILTRRLQLLDGFAGRAFVI